MKSDHDRVLDILKCREGLESEVVLDDGSSHRVWNVAWGYDLADSDAHITTNISPPDPDDERPIGFFYASAIVRIVDVDDGGLRFERGKDWPLDEPVR